MRLVSWNIENATRCIAALPAIVAHLGTPDVLCLQELRIRPQDGDAVRVLQRALPGYQCHYALANDPRNVTFRGGRMYGVATFARGRWHAEATPWDIEGRVVAIRKRGIAVVNVYAVNGTAKPYYDETGAISGNRHDLKRRFQSRIMDLGRALRRHGGVIMAGDWNVSRTAQDTHPRLRTEAPHAQARAELNARIAADGFVDIWRARHETERGYTWFKRGSRTLDAARVDYILVSDDIATAVRSAEILELLPHSDHAPIAVELSLPR